MPERSFGRTVRYRRTKMGLSQSRLGDLVGRTASTIRSWESDKSTPNDPDVLQVLAAVLAIDQRILFDKAGLEVPLEETSPTVEQALATLHRHEPGDEAPTGVGETAAKHELDDESAADIADSDDERPSFAVPTPEPLMQTPHSTPTPGYVTPAESLVITAPTVPVGERSYIEDPSQRQLYRVRNLATVVLLVALVIVFIWALSHAVSALGDWWDDFFGQLKL